MSCQPARGALLIRSIAPASRCDSAPPPAPNYDSARCARAYRVCGSAGCRARPSRRRYARPMLRSVILAAAGSSRIERVVERAPISRDVVRRFVPGTATDDALRATRELVDQGLQVSLDHLGEDTLTADQAAATKDEYLHLLKALGDAGLAGPAEVSMKLSALGQLFDETLAYEHAHEICAAAAAAGTMVTLDMEDHETT